MKKSTPVIVLVLGLTGFALVDTAQAATITVATSADTHVSSSKPTRNTVNSRQLLVDGTAGRRKTAFLKFAIPELGPDTELERVALRLRPLDSSARGVSVHRAGNGWSANNLTWRTMPDGRTRLGSSDALVSGTTEVIVLDPALVTPGEVLSIRVETRATTTLGFVSSDARGTSGPELSVTTATTSAPVPEPKPTPTPVPEPKATPTPTPNRGSEPSRTPTPTLTPTPTPNPTPTPTPFPLKVIGMSAPSHLWDSRINEVGSYGVKARRIFADLSSSGSSQLPLIREAIADGMMPVISYKVPSPSTLAQGGYDAWLATLRTQLSGLGAPVTATFWHEPHGDMDPAVFRAGSLKFFNGVDAPTIYVGPILNGWLLDRRVSDFASYTDANLLNKWEFVAVDSYQEGTPSDPGTLMPARAIPLLENWMDSVGHPDKPLGLGEYNGFSARAIAEAGETLLATREVWFGLVWNSSANGYSPLTGDMITAYQQTKADPRALH